MVTPLGGQDDLAFVVIVGVSFQELFRWLWWRTLK
jgi:hydrogenase/urease accessory protein HupE